MPNNDTVFSPSNCWAFIETGVCENCQKPRHLYANSVVHNFFGCGYCIAQKFRDGLRAIGELTGLGDEWATKYEVMSRELRDIQDMREAKTLPVFDEDNCYVCYHPFGEGAYRKLEALDGEGNTILAHAVCTTGCDKCTVSYASYDFRASQDGLNFEEMDKYLGDIICTKCVAEVKQEYGEMSFFYCDECSSHELNADSRTFNGSRYCYRCYQNNVYECSECNEEYWSENSHDCDEDISSNLIHDYSYRPRPHFFGQAKYYFGFELEVESEGNSRRAGASYVVDRLSPRVYLKNDGSLEEGFEIVSHPHTLEELQKKFNWETLIGLRKQGFRSWNTNTCGLHVHVSRTAFGEVLNRSDITRAQAHELRFIKLIYDNQRQIERLAGRTSSYAKFNDKGSLANRVKYGHQDDRYEAVNSQNEKTLEVRVFRGSLKPARVLSAVELVHASVEYTRDLKVNGNNNALKWINFVRFVADQAETYPNLVNAIQSTFDNDTPAQEID
jgi:hypothetical protein